MTRRLVRLALLPVAIVGPASLAGCADDGNVAPGTPASATTEPTMPAPNAPAPATTEPVTPAPGTTVPDTTVPPRTGVVVEVTAIDNNFRPEAIEISVGDEVVWQNRGRDDHDIVPIDSEGWGVSLADFGPGEEYRHVFTEPGTYHYYCTIHATHTVGMIGTVTVSG